MAERLADPQAAAAYKRRAGVVEPVFAHLFARFGRGLHARGVEDIEAELHVWAATHNMLAVNAARRKRRKAG
jgi:hypothetical protein